MTKKKMLLMIQSLLCILVAGLLAAAAISLYTDGGGELAEGEVLHRYTRERAGAKLLPILPVFIIALLVTAAGRIMGIRDENAEKPIQRDQILSGSDSVRESAVRSRADRKTVIVRTAVLVVALFLIIAGILNGGAGDVLAKGVTICAECIGLG